MQKHKKMPIAKEDLLASDKIEKLVPLVDVSIFQGLYSSER